MRVVLVLALILFATAATAQMMTFMDAWGPVTPALLLRDSSNNALCIDGACNGLLRIQ